jgi:hypothetical protein
MSLSPSLFSLKSEDITEWLMTFWRKFADNDKKRAHGPVYCLPCNMEVETPAIPNMKPEQQRLHSGRLNYEIDQNKAILISVTNCISIRPYKEAEKPEVQQQMTELVKEKIDKITEAKVSIDGVDISHLAHRVRSPTFELDYDYNAVTDGYWILLPPAALPKGKHILKRSSCNNGLESGTHYELTIK